MLWYYDLNNFVKKVIALLGMKIGIDFGSTNLTVYAEGKGIILCEPSVIICDKYTGKTVATGSNAKKMQGKLPGSLMEIAPIKNGVINDFDAAVKMLRVFLDKVCSGKIFKPNVLMSVPDSVSPLNKKSIFDAVTSAGAGRACFVDQSLAAAIGSGVSLTEPKGTFICDIGGGTSDSSVVTMGNIAVNSCVPVGGNDLTNTIADYILREHNIEVGRETADYIKRSVGSAVYRNEEIAVIVGGKSVETGYSVLFEITSTEVYWVLKPYVEEILNCIKSVLEKTPPELVSDIYDTGIILTGGSANLYGMDRFVEWNTGLRTSKAKFPEQCAAMGLGRLLSNMKYLENNGYVFIGADDDTDEDEA